MADVVKFPNPPPEWARVDPKIVDGLIARGYLREDQRHNWCVVLGAFNSFLYAEVFDSSPDAVMAALRQCAKADID
jgi:hypothetical protein